MCEFLLSYSNLSHTRSHLYMQAIVGVVMVLSLVVLLLSLRETTRAIDEANVETMDLALRHVAGNMQPLLEANRSAVAIADAAQEPATNDEPSPASISQVLASCFILFFFYFHFRYRHYCTPYICHFFVLLYRYANQVTTDTWLLCLRGRVHR